jgi:hypothetical protein
VVPCDYSGSVPEGSAKAREGQTLSGDEEDWKSSMMETRILADSPGVRAAPRGAELMARVKRAIQDQK